MMERALALLCFLVGWLVGWFGSFLLSFLPFPFSFLHFFALRYLFYYRVRLEP
jgi:hypothetical protein